MNIKFDINTTEATTALAELIQRGTNLRPLMAEISEDLTASTRQRFIDERSPDGEPWADLSPETWKRKKSTKKLRESDQLFGSIVPFFSNDEAGVGVSKNSGGHSIAAVHQFGSDKRNIPARPFLGLSDDDELELLDAVTQYLTI